MWDRYGLRKRSGMRGTARCAGCLTGNRAVYARLLPGDYIVLCEFCLQRVNSEMRARLPVLLAHRPAPKMVTGPPITRTTDRQPL